MNILCVIDSLGPGGAQRQLVQLAIGFKEKGFDVSFLTYHHDLFYSSLLSQHDINNVCIQESNYLFRFLKMRKFIRKGKFDAVVSFLQGSNFICELSGFPVRNWKLIVGERSANPNVFKSFKLRIYRLFHFFSDYVVSNSLENLKIVWKLNPFLSRAKCKVIYNFVSPDLFLINNNIRKDRTKLRVIVGASHRYLKNSLGMVKAYLALSSSDKSRIFIDWYGEKVSPPFVDNSYLEAIKYVKDNHLESHIKFHPATREFLCKMKDADLVALFSFYEGLPNVICEAMALGKPVLVSNISDIPILLRHNTKQTFSPTNIDSIKRGFEYFLDINPDEFVKIGEDNRNVAKELFNKDFILDQYLSLMR